MNEEYESPNFVIVKSVMLEVVFLNNKVQLKWKTWKMNQVKSVNWNLAQFLMIDWCWCRRRLQSQLAMLSCTVEQCPGVCSAVITSQWVNS